MDAAVLSRSRCDTLGLRDPEPDVSFAFPLSLEPPGESIPLVQPRPSTFGSFAPRTGEVLDARRERERVGESSSSGSSSGLPKANGELAPKADGGMPNDALLPLLPRRWPKVEGDEAAFERRRAPGCVGETRVGTSFGIGVGPGKLPDRREPLADRFDFMRSDPGVMICGPLGLGGRDIDFCVDAGLPERLVCGLAVRGRGIVLSAGMVGVFNVVRTNPSSPSLSPFASSSLSVWEPEDEVSECVGTVIA